MTVFVAFHKSYPQLCDDPVYSPLHVGKALSNSELGFEGDDTGDHISEKNKNYSELTGLYWIWKNTSSKLVGFCHYRRYFLGGKAPFAMQLKKIGEHFILQGKKRRGIHYTSNNSDTSLILKSSEIESIMEEYDIILPETRIMRYSAQEQYKRRHNLADLTLTGEIIKEITPEYYDAFNTVMNKKELFPCNMFVMKRGHFDQYMEWLFKILFELEARTEISKYDTYNQRIYGFISERLLGIWLHKQSSLRVKKLPVLYFKHLKV